jgi:hypothetical protein
MVKGTFEKLPTPLIVGVERIERNLTSRLKFWMPFLNGAATDEEETFHRSNATFVKSFEFENWIYITYKKKNTLINRKEKVHSAVVLINTIWP